MRRLSVLAVLSVSMLTPSLASADFHLVSIREVFPGDSLSGDAEYVQLQAYAPGQNVVAGHSIAFYNAAGAKVGTEAFAGNVPDGRNQMTVLMASPEAESRFAVVADETMAGELVDPAGGAVCWAALDCVSWGGFSGALPSPAGGPTPTIPDGMALRRTIAPGCPTLLEAGDDRDNSAADFAAVFPAPRPNSVAPFETQCSGSGEIGVGPVPGPAAGPRPPQTRIVRKPRKVTRDRTPTFRFRSNRRRAAFLCKVDRKRFRRCRSPFTLRRISLGRHVFRVRARAGGRVDPTPATYRFRVVKRKRRG